MEKAVDVAESNMTRFGLTAQEVASRRKWVAKTRQQVSPEFHLWYSIKAGWTISLIRRSIIALMPTKAIGSLPKAFRYSTTKPFQVNSVDTCCLMWCSVRAFQVA